MFVAYNKKYNQDTIKTCILRHSWDEPVWYNRDYYTLKEKNGKYYIYVSTPANAFGNVRYTRTFRLYFTEKGIQIIERVSFFSILMFWFFMPLMSLGGLTMILTGERTMGLVSLGIFALLCFFYGICDQKNIRDFLSRKMLE